MKNKYYNNNSICALALRIKAVYPSFLVDAFVGDIMNETWDKLELKARMRRIAITLGQYLPRDYKQAIGIIDQVIANFPSGLNDNALIYFPDFVELFGQDECNWDLSMTAIERFTPCSTAEFAVRPFIIKNEKRMMAQMEAWSKSENEHVRRLSSEGCRPALPWGQALTSFKKDPLLVLNILEGLKDDPSLYVRKSVANNLNDISKTHPDLVVKTAKAWYGKSKYTDWIVKHGCRTLLKTGNKDVLALFGFADTHCVSIEQFMINTWAVSIGDTLTFSLVVFGKTATKLRLEYAIDYVKANGKRSSKIFQLSEGFLNKNQKKSYVKAHSFADLSSRKHYPGAHYITLIANGVPKATLNFEVLAAIT